MNCPLCGSEIANNVKYCPVCGADVEAAQRRSSGQAAGYVDQTRRMPPLEDQTAPRAGQRPSRAAVPMNSSMPQQHAPRGQQQAVRNFDTSQMGGTPKWPIVLIVLLALVIIVAIVLIVINLAKPATPSAPTQTSTAASSTVDATQGTNANAPATDGATPTELTDVPAADQPATAAVSPPSPRTSTLRICRATSLCARTRSPRPRRCGTRSRLSSRVLTR